MAHPDKDAPASVDRRQFLAGTTATVALMAISGTAVLHTTEAWGLETKALKPETMRTLIQMARDIFPHDRVADKYYAIACKPYDDAAAKDEKNKEMIEAGIAEMDKRAMDKHGVAYAQVGWEIDRTALLKEVSDTDLFKKMRGDLVVSLYNQKEIWPVFGYEGESASKGGYLDRGFDDITWL
ncbi:MAG: twin-arginine translocation signal domain-containing protein [Hyphomicrobiaceae bacterium]